MEKWKVISEYSSVQAVDDGVLLDLSILPLTPKNGLFRYVTVNLLSKGYFNQDRSVNLPNVLDLLNQAVQIVKRACVQDWFYSGVVELPNGTH